MATIIALIASALGSLILRCHCVQFSPSGGTKQPFEADSAKGKLVEGGAAMSHGVSLCSLHIVADGVRFKLAGEFAARKVGGYSLLGRRASLPQHPLR